VVPGGFYDSLIREPGEWRSRELFPGRRGEVQRMRLERGRQTVELARRGEEHWIEAPVVDQAEPELVESLLGALVGLRVERFVDHPEAEGELGLDPPAGAVEAVLRGRQEPFRIEWGGLVADQPGNGAQPARYLRIGDQVVVAQAELEEHLAREPRRWRSHRWATLEPYQVQRAVIRDQGGELELEREGAEWRRSGAETVPYGVVNELLTTLSEARADRLVTQGAAVGEQIGTGQPRLTVILSSAPGREQILELFSPTGEGVPARVRGRDVVLLLPRALDAELEARLQTVRRAETVRTLEEGE
jgi:hypothetical protein